MFCPTCKAEYASGAAFCANDGTALVAEARQSLVGQIVADRYRIVRLLGEGGMGQVYEAQHVNINKRFAIKMLRPEVIGSAQSLQRFRQEAWAASSIGHENIVEIDDFATLPSGQVYLAMEFLDGQSLAERLRDGGPVPLADAVAVMVAVAHGLAAAHDKGIVHRDMKPENVFLARKSGRVVAKILDFGIAKMTSSDEPSNLTRTGAIFGTPLYMSPEQAKGKPADARADVYALGVILYELTTGNVPFGGDSSVEILSQHIGATPLPPSELAPARAIPPALEAVVMRALEKEPDARFPSMHELARALEQVAATLPAADLPSLLTVPPSPTGNRAATTGSRTPQPTGNRTAQPTPRPVATTPRPTTNPPATARTADTVGDAPARSSVARNVLIALAVLVLAALGVWRFALPHARPEAPPTIVAPATTPATTPTTPTAPTTPVAPPPTAPPAKTIEMIVDSLPTGAKIVRDGAVVADTPEALQLAGPTTIVLRKDGFIDKQVLLDPTGTRKLVVKLERAHAHGKPEPAKPTKVATAAPKPSQPVDPYERVGVKPAPATPPPAAKPAPKPAPSRDALAGAVEHRGASLGHRVGAIYQGAAADEGGRSDWFVDLEGGHCYTFVGEGGGSVKKLFLYLWGPRGKRLTQTREDTPHATMTYCTAFPGSYHFQAKVDEGQGEYRVGIFTK